LVLLCDGHDTINNHGVDYRRSVTIKKPPGSGYHCLLVRAPEETDPAKPLVVSLQNALIWYFGPRFEHFLDEGSNVLVKVRNEAKINEQNPIVMP